MSRLPQFRQPSTKRSVALAAALAATAALSLPALAQKSAPGAARGAAPAPAVERAQHWTAWGGTVGLRWNAELAADIGIRIGQPTGLTGAQTFYGHELMELRQQGAIEFDVRNGNLNSFVGGELQARGGVVLETKAGRIDLTDFRIVPQGGDKLRMNVVGADGQAWFYLDRLMYELVDNQSRLAVSTMDLRITPELAARLGHPEVADWVIADMAMNTEVLKRGADPTPMGYVPRWEGLPVPGVPGATFQADLFMQSFFMQYSRCSGCSGAGGNGDVVFTPSSTLRNNRNNGTPVATVPGDARGTSSALYAADIPWYQSFSGNFPPYGNDQHPYLIWNLYRFNADGTIDQIGRSGVKHGFLTINVSCDVNPGDGHILGRGCVDTYSVSNNDSNGALGPRSEIIPATNQWGRCGSIFDLNCDGLPNSSGNTSFSQRLVVKESQFSGPAHAGATYMFESWYLARKDIDILNSMGSVNASFTRPSTVWVVGGNNGYKLGPVIDRWVDPAAPGSNATSTMLKTNEGSVKVAAKVTDLGGGRWRYDYAVMNLDFARARTEGAEPNLRVLSNAGFGGFRISAGAATITDLQFSDGDLDASNDWTPSISGGNVYWVAPSGRSLDWGTMFRFSFIADKAPNRAGVFQLGIAGSGDPKVLKGGGTMAPQGTRGRF